MNAELAKTTSTIRASMLASSVVRATIFGAILFASSWGACTSALGNAIVPVIERTSAQPAGKLAWHAADSPSAGLLEIRRLTGFSWDQLADLFSVSRRSVHLWASGGRLSAGKEQLLYKILSTLRGISAGDAQVVRAKLLTADGSGQTLFQILKSGEFDVGIDEGTVAAVVPTRIPRSPEEEAGRRPASLAVAMDLDESRLEVPIKSAKVIRPLRAS